MPKKQSKNAFYFFMLDFKKEQQEIGVHYVSLSDVAKAADPAWKNASAEVRAQYKAKAEEEKQKRREAANSATTDNAVALPCSSNNEQSKKEEPKAFDFEKHEVEAMVFGNEKYTEEDIFVMDVNYYCKTQGFGYVIGESTVLRFSLRNGIQSYYHEMVKPGNIPLGYSTEVKLGSVDVGLEVPDEDEKPSDYKLIFKNLVEYLKRRDPTVTKLPIVFTLPKKVSVVQDFISQLCRKSGEDESMFKIYRLNTLLYFFLKKLKHRYHLQENFPLEKHAREHIECDPFKYTLGLGCEHHETNDKSFVCTTSRTKRWAYAVLDACCPMAGIQLITGRHAPPLDISGLDYLYPRN